MRYVIVALVACMSASASADLGSAFTRALTEGKDRAPHLYGLMRFAAGYTESHIDTFGTGRIREYDKAKGGFGEIDLGLLLMLHFGYSAVTDYRASMNFNGGGFRDASLTLTKYQYGGKIVLPVPWVNPFIGGGILQGSVKTRDRTGSALSSLEPMRGYYWHFGVDLLLFSFAGLRLAYQQDTIKTNRYDSLGNEEIVIDQGTGQAGLLLYF